MKYKIRTILILIATIYASVSHAETITFEQFKFDQYLKIDNHILSFTSKQGANYVTIDGVVEDVKSATPAYNYTFNIKDETLVLAGMAGGSCATIYTIISFTPGKQYTLTDTFGTCSNKPSIKVGPDSLAITFPKLSKKETVTWIYSKKGLVKSK